MTTWNAVWYAPIAIVRAYFLRRALFAMVGLDAWINNIPHGGRYGIGELRVAHFAWLDTLQPAPSAALYVGVMLATGVFALVAAIGPASRPILMLVTVLWTWGWSMSLLDGYQHHYLISLLLTCASMAPASDSPTATVVQPAWAWRLGAATIMIVYLFAAFAKIDPRWLDGSSLKGTGAAVFHPAVAIIATLGLAEDQAWAGLAVGSIIVELTLACAYLAALLRKDDHGRAPGLFLAATALAVLFHVAIHLSGYRIHWFSGYMILAAFVWLPPRSLLERIARALPDLPRPRGGPLAACLGAAALVAAGLWVELPGAAALGMTAAAVLAASWRNPARGLAAVAAAGAFVVVMTTSQVRFDYYRYLGNSHVEVGDVHAAIVAYEAAERFAPAGASRKRKIEALKDRAARSDGSPPSAPDLDANGEPNSDVESTDGD